MTVRPTAQALAEKVRLGYQPHGDSQSAAALAELVRRAEEADRLRDALTFYADPDAWEPRPQRVRPAVQDEGRIARAALSEDDG